MTEPRVKFLPDRYAFRYEDGIEFQVERFDDKKDGLTVEIQTLHVNGTGPTLLDFGRLNLSASQSRKSYAKTLSERFRQVEMDDWSDRLMYVSRRTIEEFRRGGEPFRDVSEIDVDYETPAMLLPPFVPADGVVVDYGDGEVGKGMFAIAQCVSIATAHPVLPGVFPTDIRRGLYMDWEDNEETFRERVTSICEGSGIPVPEDMLRYRRMERSLLDSEELVRNYIAENEIGFAAVDSLGMCVGADPQDPDAVIRNINAMRRLMVPVILIHHLSAEQAYGKASKEKGYGSIYIRNTARMQWLLEAPNREHGDPTIYLTNTKANRGARLSRRGYRLEFENNAQGHMLRASFEAASVSEYREVTGKLTDLERVRKVLQQQTAPVSTIAKQSGLSESAVRTVFSRNPGEFSYEKRGREKWWFLFSDRDDFE